MNLSNLEAEEILTDIYWNNRRLTEAQPFSTFVIRMNPKVYEILVAEFPETKFYVFGTRVEVSDEEDYFRWYDE